MNKREAEKIIFKAIEDCKDKTVEQMQELLTEGNELYNSVISQMIDTRKTELSYTDGTGALYI